MAMFYIALCCFVGLFGFDGFWGVCWSFLADYLLICRIQVKLTKAVVIVM